MGKSSAVSSLLVRMKSKFQLIIAFIGSAACNPVLEELMRQLCSAANSIGNTELEAKFTEGIKRIKRDIIFAASLYL